jgi:hypothetical protein
MNYCFLEPTLNVSVTKPTQAPKPQNKQQKYDSKPESKLQRKQRDKANQEAQRKVRLENNISFIQRIYETLIMQEGNDSEVNSIIEDAYGHRHGSPLIKNRKYNVSLRSFYFHLKPEIWLLLGKWAVLNPDARLKANCISAKTIAAQIRHDLGLKKGDSFVWQEVNRWGNRQTITKHLLCFDGSGLDMSHRGDLERLVDYSINTGLKGYELLLAFANQNSVNDYVRIYRGNKTITDSGMRVYDSSERALKTFKRGRST